jgi:hypothetical protein
MKIRQASLQEILQLAVQKIVGKGGGKEVSLFLPAYVIPPTKRSYRWEVFQSDLGEVKLFTRPATGDKAGWIVKVRFSRPIQFNPVVRPEHAEVLLKVHGG